MPLTCSAGVVAQGAQRLLPRFHPSRMAPWHEATLEVVHGTTSALCIVEHTVLIGDGTMDYPGSDHGVGVVLTAS
jgi:hypothetical protein